MRVGKIHHSILYIVIIVAFSTYVFFLCSSEILRINKLLTRGLSVDGNIKAEEGTSEKTGLYSERMKIAGITINVFWDHEIYAPKYVSQRHNWIRDPKYIEGEAIVKKKLREDLLAKNEKDVDHILALVYDKYPYGYCGHTIIHTLTYLPYILRNQAFRHSFGHLQIPPEAFVNIYVFFSEENFKRRANAVNALATYGYFFPNRKEIGIFVDIERFQKFYSHMDGKSRGIVPWFTTYMNRYFTERLAHEFVHYIQYISNDNLYDLPAYAEGTALAVGDQLSANANPIFLLSTLYADQGLPLDDSENIIQSGLALKLEESIEEVLRFHTLNRIIEDDKFIELKKLYSMSNADFYVDIERAQIAYLESWAFWSFFANKVEKDRETWGAIGSPLPFLFLNSVRIDSRIDSELDILEEIESLFLEYIRSKGQLDRQMAQKLFDEGEKYFVQYARSLSTPEHDSASLNRAYSLYVKSILKDPYFVTPYIYAGDICYRKGLLEQASYFYESAQRIDPENKRAASRINDVWDSVEYIGRGGDIDDTKGFARFQLNRRKIPFALDEFTKRIEHKDLSIVMIFIKAGIDISGVNSKGETPLSVAVRADYEPVVQALLHAKEEGNRKTENQLLLRTVLQTFLDAQLRQYKVRDQKDGSKYTSTDKQATKSNQAVLPYEKTKQKALSKFNRVEQIESNRKNVEGFKIPGSDIVTYLEFERSGDELCSFTFDTEWPSNDTDGTETQTMALVFVVSMILIDLVPGEYENMTKEADSESSAVAIFCSSMYDGNSLEGKNYRFIGHRGKGRLRFTIESNLKTGMDRE